MGKKTILMPVADEIFSPTMFCQDENDLLRLYPYEELGGMYGNIITPLEHTNDNYFFYRKILNDSYMLICGECHSYYSKEEYEKAKYYADEDFHDHKLFFIDEPSLTNDDEIDEDVLLNKETKKVATKLQQLKQETPTKKELRVYVIDITKTEIIGMETTDKKFMSVAEEQGTVYSIEGFEKAFNYDDLNQTNCLIKII